MGNEKVFIDVRINYMTRLIAFSMDEIKNPGILVTKSKRY